MFVLARLRGFGERHPEWWVLLVAAAAWPVMVLMPQSHAHHGHGAAAGPGTVWLGVMVAAMMLPLTVPGVRHVAHSSPSAGRNRAVAGFVGGYLAVWILAAVAIAQGWSMIAGRAGWPAAVAVAVAAAVLWELAPARRRLLSRCGRTVPLAPRGWPAGRDCLRFGAGTAAACLGTCWALMAACIAFAHSLPVMAILFGVQLSARVQRRPSRPLAVAGVLLAAAAGLASRP